MISVLVPSRERPEQLRRSLVSLGSGALEILVRVDEDDPRLSDYAGDRDVIVGPRHGYGSLHHYYNELAERATGDWLLLWNDDALMATPGWIDVVRGYDGRMVVLNPHTNHDDAASNLNVFPIVPRKMVDVMGHFSLSPHNDSWIELVARELGITVPVPIEVVHDRADLTGNNDDAVHAGRRYDSERFFSPELERLRRRDVQAIRDYLERQEGARLEPR